MITVEEIFSKLAVLADFLKELEEYGNVRLSEYLADKPRRRAVERMIQAIVDCSYDVALELLSRHGIRGTGKYVDTFSELENTGLLKKKVCGGLASTAGLRNVLVHQYDKLNDTAVHTNIRYILTDFRSFLTAIRNWAEAERAREATATGG